MIEADAADNCGEPSAQFADLQLVASRVFGNLKPYPRFLHRILSVAETSGETVATEVRWPRCCSKSCAVVGESMPS